MLNSKRKPILKPPISKTYFITIDSEKCDGCELCVQLCVTNVLETGLETNSRMLHYTIAARPDDCLGCGQCERICPSVSIFITEIDNTKTNIPKI
ncbi:MAG: 4Fe-4S dicluster domain-containing protein [Promethearchaeota archaeon]